MCAGTWADGRLCYVVMCVFVEVQLAELELQKSAYSMNELECISFLSFRFLDVNRART